MLTRGDVPPLTRIAGNAGVSMRDAVHTTSDGFETTFAVNVPPTMHCSVSWHRTSRHPGESSSPPDTHFGDLKHGGNKPLWSTPETLAEPGTSLSRDAGRLMRAAFRAATPILTSLPLADSVTAAGKKLADAIQGRLAAESGAYIDRTSPKRSSEESYDAEREQALWEYAEAVRTGK